MGLHILLAEPPNFTARKLQELIEASPVVESVELVVTEDELKNYLAFQTVDFVIVHQALVSDFSLLPRNHFLVIADKADKKVLLAVRDHDGRGYLLARWIQDMIQSIVRVAAGEEASLFLLGPSLSFEVVKALDEVKFLAPSIPVHLDVLAPQERRVLSLLHDGLSNSEIAERLCITNGSIRSYVSRIVHKLGMTREQIQHLQLP